MNNNQAVIVFVTADGKSFDYSVVDASLVRDEIAAGNYQSQLNSKTATAATIASAIQTELGGCSLSS